MRKYIISLVVAISVVLGVGSLRAQSLTIQNAKGEDVAFESLITGDEPIILAFWATWCKPCLNELDAYMECRDEWQDQIRFLAISIDDERTSSKVVPMMQGKNYPFEVYLDKNQALSKSLNVRNVPFVMVYYQGRQVYMHSGYNPGDEFTVIDEALKQVKAK